jgi:SPP1 gp7 family putative phage head morphogenesis protein
MEAAAEGAGITATFNRLPVAAIENLVGMLGDGSPLKTLLDQLPGDGRRIVSEGLLEAVSLGIGPAATARKIRQALDFNQMRALMISRTETLRAYRTATLQSYQANAETVRGWYWRSARSSRSCAACIALDGIFFQLNEPSRNHVRCRCTLLPGIKSVKVDRGTDWFDEQDEQTQRDILGTDAGFEAFKSGKLKLEDFVGLERDAQWGDSFHQLSVKRALAGEANFPGGSKKPPAPGPAPAPSPPPKQRKARKLKPIPGRFTTIDEAEAWASKKYPHIAWDLSGADVENINPTLMQFDKLAKQWPQVVERLKFFTTYQNISSYKWNNAYAHTLKTGEGVGINPKWYGQKDMATMTKLDVIRGWHPIGTHGVESIITHEFGHLIEDWIVSKIGQSFTKIVRLGGEGLYRQALNAFMKENKATPALSAYALKDEGEAWAESFAAIHHSPRETWTRYTKKQYKFLRAIKDLPSYKYSEYTWSDRVSAEERDAALAELEAIFKKLGLKPII